MSKVIDFKDYWRSLTPSQRDRVIAEVQTSEGYMDKLCGGHCYPSLPMAQKLLAACNAVKKDRTLTYESFLMARERRLLVA